MTLLPLLAIAAVLVAGVASLRARFWRDRAQHWFARSLALEGELMTLKFRREMQDRGITYPTRHSPFAAGDWQTLIEQIPTVEESR